METHIPHLIIQRQYSAIDKFSNDFIDRSYLKNEYKRFAEKILLYVFKKKLQSLLLGFHQIV